SGETRNVTLTIFPENLEPGITKTVSDAHPESGDQVTYTIRAYGSPNSGGDVGTFSAEPVYPEFEITDTLPDELSDIAVTCEGVYQESLPGTCYELDGHDLTAFGQFAVPPLQGGPAFSMTLTVTGTITGEPD